MNKKLTGAGLAALICSTTAAAAAGPEPDTRAQQAPARPAPDAREPQKSDAERFGENVGRATTTAATDLAEVAGDLTRSADRPGLFNPVAIEVNPLGLIVGGRLSANVEVAPVTHHVLIVSPHFIRTSATIAVGPSQAENEVFTGVGTEVGYRYYTGHNGMNGIFVGPSILGGVYEASLPGGSRTFTNVGVAVDVGYQQVLLGHVVLGAGVGLEYLHVSEDFHDLPTGPSAIASSGLKPRLLAQAGYAF